MFALFPYFRLIEEHAQFEDTLRSRQPDFDEATKGRRRQDQAEAAAQGKDTKAKKPRYAFLFLSQDFNAKSGFYF